jgi:hypothetical protein
LPSILLGQEAWSGVHQEEEKEEEEENTSSALHLGSATASFGGSPIIV